jgi:hypothetical protein
MGTTYTLKAIKDVTVVIKVEGSDRGTTVHMKAGQIYSGVLEIITVEDPARIYPRLAFNDQLESPEREQVADLLRIEKIETRARR